ncbi:Two-pore potassium channel 5 [Ananas comosus]|uniref:Two-pore potassium channel 5 n=1 Tax=Ananas comosus TaxID=4615 RepID=A0A199W0N6_ANACO|nr:Two-pore potassium channel 5 [Ananas comosus]
MGEEEKKPLLPLLRSHLSSPLPLSDAILLPSTADEPSSSSAATADEPSSSSAAADEPSSSSAAAAAAAAEEGEEDGEDPCSYGFRRKSGLHRARTAPSMAVLLDLLPSSSTNPNANPGDGDDDDDAEEREKKKKKKKKLLPPGDLGSSGSILRTAALLLLLYLCLGVVVYSADPRGFSGAETHPAVDALYFCIVTLCTIGYGDIAPLTPATKAFSCLFVLVGFGLVDALLSGAVSYVLDLQESAIIAAASASASAGPGGYIFDAEKGRMRIRLKVALAVAVVVLCVGAGTVALYWIEHLDWMDSFYLSVMSVTTVGYGDRAFKTLPGRVFASFWLLVSTLAVARAFLFLAEARIDRRHRRIVKWVLQRDLTVEDLLAADLNRNGFIRSVFSSPLP